MPDLDPTDLLKAAAERAASVVHSFQIDFLRTQLAILGAAPDIERAHERRTRVRRMHAAYRRRRG